MCRPGIVPGQKYSPATECVVLVGRIGAGAASPAWLVSPAGRRSPNYTIPPRSCSYKFLPPICLHFSSFTHVQPAITLHPKDWNYCENICPLNSTIQKLPRNLAQKFGNGNVHQCTVLQKSLLPKCMQAHLPVRKGTAVSWVQPKFGNGDSDEAGV